MDKKRVMATTIRVIAIIVFVILVIKLIPLPFNEELDEFESVGSWKFVIVQEGNFKGRGASGEVFPKCSVDNQGYMHVISVSGSLSYIEATFVIPERGTMLAYEQKHGALECCYIELYDSRGVRHVIRPVPTNARDKTNQHDISRFAGQRVTIRMLQSSDLASMHWYYRGFRVMNEPYTIYDNLDIIMHTVGHAFWVSILIGVVIGVLGLETICKTADRIHAFVHNNRTSCLGFENKYIRGLLKIWFYYIDTPMRIGNVTSNIRLRTGIKIAMMLFTPFAMVYITYIVTYVVGMIMLVLLILAAIIWILFSSGDSSWSSSTGSSGGNSSGGGKDYVTEYGRTHDHDERVVKQDGKTYRRGSIFELDADWHADKDGFGNDKVERDWDGSPKIKTDVTGKQIIEGDSFGDPIIEPESKRGK